MRGWSGTARRLFVAFAVLIAVYGATSAFALMGLAEIQDGLRQTGREAEGMRLALELASAVRDQYAHQAHTIIIGDLSHIGFYADAEKRVLDLTRQVRGHVEGADEKAWVDDIEKASSELDDIFRKRIVPAVLAGRRSDVQEEHARAQLVVTRIQDLTERLVERFEGAIGRVQAHVTAVERRVFRLGLVFLLGAPLLAVGVGVYLVRSVARPVARLQAGAERIAAGDLSTPIDIDTPDEFGALARRFNAMTGALREHQEKLVQSEKLAGIGRLAAGVAHEINNPLGVILGYARLLGKGATGALAEDLGVIEQETRRCQEIVDGLLDLSRPMKQPAEPVDLRELADEVVSRLAEADQLGGARVSVDGGASVEGQGKKLRQVLVNLVRNAVDAAGAGGRVEVHIGRRDGSVELSVIDSGPGISAVARARLFEPFFTTKPRGTGLGLAVSQAIARAHGGSIDAGAAPGGGACFTLRLPAAAGR